LKLNAGVIIRLLARDAKKKHHGRVSEFLQRAGQEIQRHNLFSRGQRILVAVSGGADSMVLLYLLNSLAGNHRWKISVAHFNHQLRGRASDGDEQLVRQTAKKMGLPFFFGRADVKRFAAQSKISIEMAARKLRHEFFARIAQPEKLSTIALAHHADDQVELFFLRLLRGTGGAGLGGMKRGSPSPAGKSITLVRPLLGFFKAEILEFARENRILFREDASNLANQHLRNRIRNELLPLLKSEYQPGLAGNVLRLMEIIGAESELAGETARRWRERGVPKNQRTIENQKSDLAKSDFAGLPPAIQRKILQQQLIELGVAADFELVEQLRETAGKFISVGSAFSVARDAGGGISLRGSSPVTFNPAKLKWKLSGRSGRVEFGGKEFRWRVQPQKRPLDLSKLPKRGGVEMFDADRIGEGIILRHWRAGDRFQPIGLASPVKLQDLFMNAKVPVLRRRSLVLATTLGGEIFWVEGLRISERFKLTAATRRKWLWARAKNGRI
jgi:tRNA(Ile)-lysidine synthase